MERHGDGCDRLRTELGYGGIVSPNYVRRRLQIESERDDGTERLFIRCNGDGHAYDDGGRPDDHSHPSALQRYGLPIRDLEACNRNGCEEIADVRSALLAGEIATLWKCSGPTVEKRIREALSNLDAEICNAANVNGCDVR